MMPYRIEVSHKGLNKHRIVTGSTEAEAGRKADALAAQWDEMWERKCRQEEKQREKERRAAKQESHKAEANERTTAALNTLSALDSILVDALELDHIVQWDQLKDHCEFAEPQPKPPAQPLDEEKPDPNGLEYAPKLGILGRVVPSIRDERIRESNAKYEDDLKQWELRREANMRAYEEATERHERAVVQWEERRTEYEHRKAQWNGDIDKISAEYSDGSKKAVEIYCEAVLNRLLNPLGQSNSWDLEYTPAARSLIVDYLLPNPEDIPTLKEVRYIQSRDEFKETHVSNTEATKRYDRVIYQLCLRTIYALVQSDWGENIEGITFNGWVHFKSPETGNETTACIMSLHGTKADIQELNLNDVDPKACFKALRGVGSSKLHSLSAIAPIATIQREDARFVPSMAVAEHLDEGDNLAAMDWEDFEHLVRELFEQEFTGGGGEVKITRASRDAGVDAIAFDPDPIRGGKFVIQAKRYTRTVGVSAVRDLYGTVLNEGASKGILVTTADYGPDAYQFAKDKPLTLLNGSNLLHLLQKHGYRARIDVTAARAELE